MSDNIGKFAWITEEQWINGMLDTINFECKTKKEAEESAREWLKDFSDELEPTDNTVYILQLVGEYKIQKGVTDITEVVKKKKKVSKSR